MIPHPFGTFPKIHPFWKGNASLKGGYLTRDFCISPKRALDMWYIFVSVRTDTFENIVRVAGKIASVGCDFQIYFPAHHICQKRQKNNDIFSFNQNFLGPQTEGSPNGIDCATNNETYSSEFNVYLGRLRITRT